MTTAEDAVSYTLKRCRLDANLRYHMLGTEAFARLCAAEASRTGKTEDEVKATYSKPADHCRDELPLLVECRKQRDDLLNALRDVAERLRFRNGDGPLETAAMQAIENAS